MLISFRGGFYGGLVIALFAGLYLIWLWQLERQMRRHTENFLQAIEHKNWDAAFDFVAANYQDQWGDDRMRVLERLREGLDMCAVHESSRPIRACRLKAYALCGVAKLRSTAPTTT